MTPLKRTKLQRDDYINDSLDSGKRYIEGITNLFLLAYLVVAIVLDFVSGNKAALTYHIILIPIFLITYGLYFLRTGRLSQILLISLLITSLVGSIIILNYFIFFKYTIILPISLAYIFFGTDKKKITLNVFIIVNVLIALACEVFIQPQYAKTTEELVVAPFVYISFIFCYIIIHWYFTNRLSQVLEKLSMFKEISDFSNEGIAVKDQNQKYIFQNATNEKILGYTVDELHEKAKEMTLLKNHQVIRSEEGLKDDGIYEIETRKGKRIVDFLSYNVSQQEETKYIVEIKRDITEKHNLELRIKEKDEKLREANLAKDKLFSIIAHDIKTPFNSILGLSDIIVNDLSIVKDELIHYVKQINTIAKNTYQLLENLLGWALVQQEKITVNTESIDVHRFIRNQVELYSGLANAKGIQLKAGNITAKSILFDVNMLKAVFRNIISNSIKFCVQGDSITLSAEEQKSNVVLSIADTGAGMTKEELNKLRTATFLNESKIGTQREKGTGLGLVLCKEFIKRNNGKLVINSKLNGGTTLEIHVPISHEEADS